MKKEDKAFLLLIIIFALIALIPLFQSGFMGYDFIFQGARLASFYKNLKEGVILPRWAGQLNSGYGHPVLIFLYPFVFYLGSFWHWLGFSIVSSIKILFTLGFVFSGVFMYLFSRKLWEKKIAFAAALFYLFTPYHLLNIFGRAALGEHLGICFFPLILLAFTNIFKTEKLKLKDGLFLGLALVLTVLSHNLIILLASPLIIAFVLFLSKDFSLKYWKSKLSLIFFGLVAAFFLTAFFWGPVVFEKKYTLYDEIASPGYYKISLASLSQIFLSPHYGLTDFKLKKDVLFPSVSPTQWFLVFLGGFYIFKFWHQKKKEVLFVLFLNFYFLFGVFLSTSYSFGLVRLIPQIAFFQQAFRFLNIPLFVSPFLLLILVKALPKRYLNKFLIVFIIINFIVNVPYFWNIKITRQFKDDDYFYHEYRETADTGQITPRWGVINYLETPPQKVQLVWGKLEEFTIQKWDSQEHIYSLKLREDSQIADNTLYFPGWKVRVDGEEVPLNFQDMNWRGVITYPVPAGEHEVSAKFEETKLRLLADYLSLGTLFLIVLSSLMLLLLKLKKRLKF